GITVLIGITFDTTGSFDHRMLVLGIAGTKSVVVAVDCNGATEVITRTLPSLEGQMAVAPDGFGAFGGNLIIPEERGRILAVAPNGLMRVVLAKLPAGVDKTIGGLGFVPAGFTERGGAAYHADRKTHGSAWPGTDTMLRLKSE